MASRNSVKLDIEGGFYHIYNRGVEKRNIFEDKMDYNVFLNYIKEYLSPKDNKENIIKQISFKDTVFKGVPRVPNNYYKKVELICYCLMPNHFHFLIRQNVKGGMKRFVHSLLLRYSTYFNRKNTRVGPLFQGRYKAVLVDSEAYLLHLSRYIHLNPSELDTELYKAYSSYKNYLGVVNTSWINVKTILGYFKGAWRSEFKNAGSYKNFVENYKNESQYDLADLVLE